MDEMESIKIARLGQRCIEIQTEMIAVHDELTEICKAAKRARDEGRADRCVEASALLVDAGASLVKAQRAILSIPTRPNNLTGTGWFTELWNRLEN